MWEEVFADTIKLKILMWGNYPGFSGWAPMELHVFLEEGGGVGDGFYTQTHRERM